MTYRWLWLLCLLLPCGAMASGVQATLDRNNMHLGETVTLSLRVDGSMNANTPDLGALNNDFDVLGSSTNSTLTVENGHPTAQVIIGIALRPKRAGDLQIPALTVGDSQTTPLTLHVDPPDQSVATSDAKNVFVEVVANPDHVYAGQQLLLTVRLFYNVNLNGGTLPDPHADGADLRRLGGDTDYDADRGGRRYHVVERRYALIPQHAGSLTIPAIEFQGDAVDPGSANDPGFGGLFGNSTPISVDSSPITIDVQAPPANWGNTTWLPARSLTLSVEGLPGNGQVTVGQPINLHMIVQATGLSADVLPEPTLPTIDGAKVYPDQPTNTTQDDGQWLSGRRERGFAIFPQHAGTLTIPAITLTWFDVQSGQQQIATVPARNLTVVPAANAAPASSTSAMLPAQNSIPAVADSAAEAGGLHALATLSRWRWVAIASVGLWLLSVIAFLLWRRRKPPSTSTTSPHAGQHARGLRQAFMDAARRHDAALQAQCLLAWARAERPDLRNLGDVSMEIASDSQRAAIERLQRLQFAGDATGDAIDFAAVFAQGFVWRTTNGSDGGSPLPPLYPFKLD